MHNRQWKHLCEIGKNCNNPHLQSKEKRKHHQMAFSLSKDRPYIMSSDNCYTFLAPGCFVNSWWSFDCGLRKGSEESWRVKQQQVHGQLCTPLGCFALSHLPRNLTAFIHLLRETVIDIIQNSGFHQHVFYFTNTQACQTQQNWRPSKHWCHSHI